MKKKYRIKKCIYPHPHIPHFHTVVFTVQVRNILGIWTNVKDFHDLEDGDFAKREAAELFDKLIEP